MVGGLVLSCYAGFCVVIMLSFSGFINVFRILSDAPLMRIM